MSKQPTAARKNKPPKLGDVTYCGHGDSWTLFRGEREVCRGLTFNQLLAVIRGDVTVDAVGAGNGN